MALIMRQHVAQVIRGCNIRSDQMTSIRSLGETISIISIHVYTSTTYAEIEIESLYTNIQEEADHAPKGDMLIFIDA